MKDVDGRAETQVHHLPKSGSQAIHRSYGLWIFGAGSYRTQADSFEDCPRRYFEFYSISHMYDGRGRVWFEAGCDQEIEAGKCVIVCPDTVNRYGGWGGMPYVEDCMQFSGAVADQLAAAGILRTGVYSMGRVRRLLPVMQLMRDPAVDAQIRANMELQKLLLELYLDRRTEHTEHPGLEKLLEEIKGHLSRWWTVGEMAELCNMSEDQLRRRFVQATGMKPKAYVDRLKARKAADLLAHTALTVNGIAAMLGYEDQYHFSRRFKTLAGVSPAQYRKNAPESAFSGLRGKTTDEN